MRQQFPNNNARSTGMLLKCNIIWRPGKTLLIEYSGIEKVYFKRRRQFHEAGINIKNIY